MDGTTQKQTQSQRVELTHYQLLTECRDQKMQEVIKLVDQCKNFRTVLITGENGTGKELVARALHGIGDRHDKHLAILDCTNFSAELMRSELFGHVRGAFTGATEDRVGAFEQADCGTVFLDEIGEIPIDLQPKLLRVLQTKEFTRLGSSKVRTSDFRLIAATNRDIPGMISTGEFREDLYYRIQAVTIPVAPLRERMDDILRLSNHLLDELSGAKKQLTDDAEKAILAHSWPGNVRELRNCIERAVLFSDGHEFVAKEHLALTPVTALTSVRKFIEHSAHRSNMSRLGGGNAEVALDTAPLQQIMECLFSQILLLPLGEIGSVQDHIEKLLIQVVLKHTRGNKLQAAMIIGCGRQTLYNKLEKYGLRAPNEPLGQVSSG